MQPLRVFTGFDDREVVGWHVFASSAIRNSSVPLQITPLRNVVKRHGTNAFTFSRFAIPYLCGFIGKAIYLDGVDMLVREGVDLAELVDMLDFGKGLAVVRHDYQSKHPKKYVGTAMEAVNQVYPGKNQSSLMIFDCGFAAHRKLTPERIEIMAGLHQFLWMDPDRVQELDPEWNWLADEFGENQEAKILHWTAGQVGFRHYRNSPHAADWLAEFRRLHVGFDEVGEFFDSSPMVSER